MIEGVVDHLMGLSRVQQQSAGTRIRTERPSHSRSVSSVNVGPAYQVEVKSNATPSSHENNQIYSLVFSSISSYDRKANLLLVPSDSAHSFDFVA